MAPKYEEMQRTLDFVPEPYRAILLGNALSSALNSNNPIESMQVRSFEFDAIMFK
ncbi:MAG TPA: hypothetical protein VE445_12340 [Nitrososphaeraceae archaeon]|nr:hypothetical protein [Nitrososphaeraceae archaeon]